MSKTARSKWGACSLPPNSYVDKTSGEDKMKGHALMSKDVWTFTEDELDKDHKRIIKYFFVETLGWSEKRKDAVEYTIKKEKRQGFETWEDCANIIFNLAARVEEADIRIAFEPGSSWSAVGEGAKRINKDKPTLNLGWLKDEAVPDEGDRGTILHEFGHALGMMHEHQSPARGQFIHLKEIEVYRYYRPLLGDRATVKSQIIDTYNEGKIMNMSRLDLESVMMYFMPAYLNEEGIDIPVNTKLSKLDKAFIMLNYPPKLDDPNNLRRFMQAMIDAGVTNKAAGDILEAYNNPDPTGPSLPSDKYAPRFGKVRERFSEYNKRTTDLRSSNATLVNTIDTESLAQFGIKDFLGSVVKNKLVQSIMKNVVKNTLLQRGIRLKESIPGASPPEVARMIGALSMHPEVAAYVDEYKEGLKVANAVFPGAARA